MNDIPEKPTAQIIKGPWKKRNVKVPSEAEQRLREELEFAEDVIDQLMIHMIHTISDNGFDVNGNDFLKDMGFVIEVVRSLIYKEMGLHHPLTDIMSELVIAEIDPSNKISTSLDVDKAVMTSKFLHDESIFNKDDPPEVS